MRTPQIGDIVILSLPGYMVNAGSGFLDTAPGIVTFVHDEFTINVKVLYNSPLTEHHQAAKKNTDLSKPSELVWDFKK